MNKKGSKRRAKSIVPKETARSMEAKNRAEDEISATPGYRRAKTLVGIASTLGMAVIAIRATRRHFWGNDEDDGTQNN